MLKEIKVILRILNWASSITSVCRNWQAFAVNRAKSAKPLHSGLFWLLPSHEKTELRLSQSFLCNFATFSTILIMLRKETEKFSKRQKNFFPCSGKRQNNPLCLSVGLLIRIRVQLFDVQWRQIPGISRIFLFQNQSSAHLRFGHVFWKKFVVKMTSLDEVAWVLKGESERQSFGLNFQNEN